MARAIWKGVLKAGSTAIPVKLYAAVEDRDVHFHLLQPKTKLRVKQHLIDSTGGAAEDSKATKSESKKGYEIESGTFVILEEEELKKLQPKDSRDIALARFVPHEAISNAWYERAYYLAPDGKEGEYFALAEAMTKKNVEAIARWTMRGKSYVGALLPAGDYLALIKLRYAEEVLSAQDLPQPTGPSLDSKELRMAEELVGAMDGKFEPDKFHDEYRERMLAFIKAKAKGRPPRLATLEPKEKVASSLTNQLAKSLAALKPEKRKKVA
jgi:DNA end-binding protein Ku